MDAIQVEELTKFFKTSKGRKGQQAVGVNKSSNTAIIKAVDQIHFSVKAGEIFGFLGPNGAGKTTTIRMMTGVLKPSKGSIKILGLDAQKHPIAVKQITGNVPEMANVYLSLSGWQNLMFMGELYSIPKDERKKRAEILLKKFDLYEKRDLKSNNYSKGMKQRLLLCMALMNNPKILFLDEPTSGLDVQSAQIIKKLIREYQINGVTIFLTTHDMETANELCDRIAIINQGKIISLDTPQNLKNIVQEYQAIDLQFSGNIEKEVIGALKSVKKVETINEGFRVIVKDVHESTCELVELTKHQGIKIKHINTHQPKLEEAFLKIIERGGIGE